MLRRFARGDNCRIHGTGLRLRGLLAFRRESEAVEQEPCGFVTPKTSLFRPDSQGLRSQLSAANVELRSVPAHEIDKSLPPAGDCWRPFGWPKQPLGVEALTRMQEVVIASTRCNNPAATSDLVQHQPPSAGPPIACGQLLVGCREWAVLVRSSIHWALSFNGMGK
jgi:hypothetical protein